jgi:hypothetical protein
MLFDSVPIKNGRPPGDQREITFNSGWPPKRSSGDMICRGLKSGGDISGPGWSRDDCGSFAAQAGKNHKGARQFKPNPASVTQSMVRISPFEFLSRRLPRFIAFDAGVVAGLLGIGVYFAILNRHWIAATFLALGVVWIISVPLRLRVRRSNGGSAHD